MGRDNRNTIKNAEYQVRLQQEEYLVKVHVLYLFSGAEKKEEPKNTTQVITGVFSAQSNTETIFNL